MLVCLLFKNNLNKNVRRKADTETVYCTLLTVYKHLRPKVSFGAPMLVGNL